MHVLMPSDRKKSLPTCNIVMMNCEAITSGGIFASGFYYTQFDLQRGGGGG